MHKSNLFISALALLSMIFIVGCAPMDTAALKATGQDPIRDGQNLPENPNDPTPGQPGDQDPGNKQNGASQKIVLNKSLNLQYLKANVLEFSAALPVGTQLEVPDNYQQSHLDFRTPDGKLERSSTGFIYPVKILSAPSGSGLSSAKIEELNKTSGGLYAPGAIVSTLQGTAGSFAAISPGTAGSGFLSFYFDSGKPKFNYLSAVTKRFGARLNKGVDPNALSAAERTKWQAIHGELVKAANRAIATPRMYLMVDQATADYWSKEFEKSGAISPVGAWTIATESTAVRHGFPNVPCAEFQSELVRQAYQRAGYRLTDDFNTTKGNHLLWSNTASVVGFSAALYAAGWVPWDTLQYRPVTGAIMMNGAGNSPGHTYIAAGDDGRFFVDNGYPQGKDIRTSSKSSIEMSYQAGVFFLPPGVNPPKW